MKPAVLVLLFALVGPASAQAPPPLRPVSLVAGQADTALVTDLFESDEPLRFEGTPDVAVEYLAEAGLLVLQPRPDFEGLTLVPFTQDAEGMVLPVRVRILAEHTFTYRPDRPDTDVFVIGQFNDWARGRDRLTDPDADGVFEIALLLEPGRYEYKFTVDGEEVLDPQNADRVPNGIGGINNVLVVPPRHAERTDLFALPTEETEEGLVLHFAYTHGSEPAPIEPHEVVALAGNRLLPPERIEVANDRIAIPLRPAERDEVIRVAVSRDGQATPFATVHPPGGLGSEWNWRDAVLYQIVIDRFADGDSSNSKPVPHDSLDARANYHGGDLQGILDKLEEGYLDSLGVNVLWLSPVVDNPSEAYREYPPPHRYYTGYHGYWPIHSERVEERFGDMTLLRRVVEAAHARGMRVLLDYVANHVHEEHPYVLAHPDWFGTLDLPDGRKNLRLWDEHRLTTWFEPYLPSFDYAGSDEALETMTDNAVWWLRETGADGFRHDAVKHIPNRFWRTLTRKIRDEIDLERTAGGEPPTYQIGETFGSYDLISSYVTPGQLDAQFNFNLYDAAKYVFLDSTASFAVLDAEMRKTLDVYGADHVMGNIMDSHDKTRFLAYADGDIARDAPDDKEVGWTDPPRVDDPASYRLAELYLAYLLTTPGVPTIYYGDEIGMTGANDPDNRRPMRFGAEVTADERALKEDVARLVQLRRDRSPLRRGGFHTLRADGNLWIYLRDDSSGSVLVALNKGTEPETLSLALPLGFDTAIDVLEGGVVSADDEELTLSVPAVGYRVLALE